MAQREMSRADALSASERARRRLREAAADLLGEVGFGEMTMDAVVNRAGASKATLYRHWPTKAALVMDAFMAEVDAEAPFPDTGSVLDDFREQMRLTAKLFGSGRVRNMLAGLIVAMPDDPELRDAFRRRYMVPRRAQGEAALQRGVARGELRSDIDSAPLFDQLYGALYLRVIVGAPLTRRYSDAAVDQAFRGLLNAGTGSRARPR